MVSATKTKAKTDEDEIRRALNLLYQGGDVVELRILNTSQGTVSGYYDDMEKLRADAARYSGSAPAIYTTLNPCIPDLLARAVNRLKPYAKSTTSDDQIVCRRWLPIDLDCVRPAGISASDAERDAVFEMVGPVHDWLRGEMGFPRGVVADSGNGAHLLFPIDLPNDEASTDLVRRCLESLSEKFSNDHVKIDTSTANAARIWKLYGTIAAKGDDTADRPHRTAHILETTHG